MKNSQKGFIVPVLVAIIALLVIGGGVYIYKTKKTETPLSNTETQSVATNQTILNSLVTDWKKIAPSIIPGFPAVSQAFYGYPDIIQFIGNNRVIISYQDDSNPLFAVLSYDTNQKQFSYLDGLRTSPFKVSETLWNTWKNKYGEVSFTPQTYQFFSTRTGDVVYSSDWKLITKNPFVSATQTKPPTPSPKDETANWEIYRSEKYGIEFKHPAGWYIYDGIDGGSGLAIYERKVGPGLPGVSRLMNIYRHGNETTDVKTYAEKNTINTPIATDTTSGLLKKEQGYVTVAQIQSYQIYTKTIDRDGPMECYNPPCDWSSYKNVESLVVRTYVPHKSAIFEVSVNMGGEISTDAQKKKINPQEETSYLNTYKLILSTIKFLN